MSNTLRFVFLLFFLFVGGKTMAQITTSGIRGLVADEQSEPVVGATVLATHIPSGTRYGGVTDADGRYYVRGMRTGGPYRIVISFVGMQTSETDGVNLKLGEVFRHDVKMVEATELLSVVVISARAGIDATKTGAAMNIDAAEINRTPSVSHSIADMLRMNPQVRSDNDGAMFFLGTNNRYNSFRIDGVMNNDVYGLAANGSNGGQAGTQPVSMETIEQIQINITPFDIRQSGFTGGSVNAVTKSGTNEFHGSLYGFGNNEKLIGRRYRLMNGLTSEKYPEQYEYQAGITLGGPVVRNKLFFFANYEKADKTYQNPYAIGKSASRVDAAVAQSIWKKLQEMAAAQGVTYGGNLDATDVYTKSDKAGIRLDWNINDKQKLSFRWSLVSARQMNSASTALNLNATDYSYDFVSKTSSFVAELQSRLSDRMDNELRVSYVRVRDRREPGAPFPMVQVNNVGDGILNLGNDRSSMANTLDQDIWSFTDNLTYTAGKHTLVMGTHNEFYHFSNLFIQDAFGSYFFDNPDDFYAGRIKEYRFGEANVAVTGDTRWAAAFRAGMLGFYVQDNFSATDRLDLTFGLRADIPLFFDTPAENATFNDFMASRGWNYKTNSKLNSRPLFSPRLGFRWNVGQAQKYVLRGGAGIFTGRIPYVWLSNNFANTGVQLSVYRIANSTDHPDATKDLSFILDPAKQGQNAGQLTVGGSQTINIFDKDFKHPQNFRANLALDFSLGGIRWTAEAIYSKTLNDITYRNLAVDLNGKTLGEAFPALSFDRRPLLSKIEGAENYTGIYVLRNTGKGYTYHASLSGEKKFAFGLDVRASYTFMRSRTQNNGTSSVAQSNWQYNYTYQNPNRAELANSSFNIPHSIKASVFYTGKWNKNQTTTVGLLYNGSSGIPYNVCYNGDLNGDTGNNDLIYIPTDEEVDRMTFSPTSAYTAEQQKANFKAWLSRDEYMKEHRGEYSKRNAGNEKFEHHFDFHLSHRLQFMLGKSKRELEFSLDIINIGNMLNKDWGRTSASYGYYNPINYKGDGSFQFLHDADYNMRSYNDYYSRWRGQTGVRLIFNVGTKGRFFPCTFFVINK